MRVGLIDSFLLSGTIMSSDSNTLLIGYGKREWRDSPLLNSDPCFYFPDFSLCASKPWFTQESVVELTFEAFGELISDVEGGNQTTYSWSCSQQPFFNEAFEELKKLIERKKLSKAVLYVFEEACVAMTKARLLQSLRSLLNYAHHFPVYIYGFWDQDEGILGGTPELLFSLDHSAENFLRTMAMAGTRQTKGVKGSLIEDPKEMKEHQLVVASIHASLSAFGNVWIGKTKEVQLSHFSHLMTPIEAALTHLVNFEDIVREMHPTAALGVFPKEAGKEWLDNYQKKISRKRYGAPTGYVKENGRSANCYVAIRNMQWNSTTACIGAGCGVIAESQKEREWEEIKLKLKSIRSILAL